MSVPPASRERSYRVDMYVMTWSVWDPTIEGTITGSCHVGLLSFLTQLTRIYVLSDISLEARPPHSVSDAIHGFVYAQMALLVMYFF